LAQTITEQSDVVMVIPSVGPAPYGFVPMYNVPPWLLYEPCPFMVVAYPPPIPPAPCKDPVFPSHVEVPLGNGNAEDEMPNRPSKTAAHPAVAGLKWRWRRRPINHQ